MQKLFIISGKFTAILLGFLVLLGLYLTSLYSYLLFHSLVELFSIVIACGVFMIAWNSRRFLDNNYLLFIGIAYLFVGGLDLIHTLGYTGMGVFEGYGTNLPAQLWIATRYLESLSLLIAFSFLGRRLRPNFVLLSYTMIIALLLVSIFYWNIFPVSFVEGVGLTPFKKISEYIISLILMASVVLLFRNRTQFDRGVLRLLVASIVITIGSELFFTFYISAYGLSNLIGHFLKIISFYLIYKAIIDTGIRNPFDLLFRNLKQSEETLRKVNDELEVRVEGRTSELTITNEQLTEEISQRRQAQYDLGERVKELECLYGITMITERPAITLDAVNQEVANVIPPGWQYPDTTCARVTIDGKEFATPNFRETAWKLASDIIVDGQRIGTIEVYYLEEKPENDEGPFLKEERNLINGIARQLGDYIQRKQAEEAKEHLFLIIRTIRNVNQLIVKEKNRDRLLKSICANFTKTKGCSAAWIALLDESGGLITVAESGWGKDFLPMVRQLKRGEWPDCGQKALRQSAVVVTGESSPTCAGCPLAKGGYNKGALTVRLEHNGKIYGLLSANLPVRFLAEPEELSLFEEIAGDIGFSLHSMELEEERKIAEEEIRKFKTIADNAPYGVSISDLDGNLMYVNKSYAEMHGYTSDELIGKHYTTLYPDSQFGFMMERRKRIIKTGQSAIDEVWRKRKDGTIFPALATGSLVRDDKGIPLHIAATHFDLTERKKMEEQLLTNDRLASIGELVSGVAHELNNPLTGVIGFSDLLAGRKDLPNDIKEDIQIINREARRTSNIVKNLLTFARKHPKEKQATDVNKAIEVVLELREYEQKVSNIQVNTQCAPDLPEITANSFDLQQVFMNILVNAEHAMLEAHGGGIITITTEQDGDIIRASLADDGPGVSEENLGHMFDPFFTTKEVGKGTGLGLSICHGIITEHGGRIYAESELGKGTTFIIELPVATTDNEGPTNEKS